MTIVGNHHVQDLPHKTVLLWWQARGLSYTASGYGRKIPTGIMVQLPGSPRWRRVYCCIYSNIGTCYVFADTRSKRADGTVRPDWIVIEGTIGGPNYLGQFEAPGAGVRP